MTNTLECLVLIVESACDYMSHFYDNDDAFTNMMKNEDENI